MAMVDPGMPIQGAAQRRQVLSNAATLKKVSHPISRT
ncbi:MAG: hypothetical protein ACI9ZH_001110, partial [Paracoccaceae bacterium]